MAMVTMMVTATSSTLAGLHLEGRDGLWEIACAPHSCLSQAAKPQNNDLKPRRINLQAGYDLYKASSWEQLRHLRRWHRPRKLWFSLPCTKWCQWTQVTYNTPERRQRLEDDRRRERRLLWFANGFIREAVTEDPDLDIYWEWTFPNHGWRQVPMLDLAAFLEGQEIPWLSCRINGCRYGLKDTKGEMLIRKKWMIKTSSLPETLEARHVKEDMNMPTSKGWKLHDLPTIPGGCACPLLGIGESNWCRDNMFDYLNVMEIYLPLWTMRRQ